MFQSGKMKARLWSWAGVTVHHSFVLTVFIPHSVAVSQFVQLTSSINRFLPRHSMGVVVLVGEVSQGSDLSCPTPRSLGKIHTR